MRCMVAWRERAGEVWESVVLRRVGIEWTGEVFDVYEVSTFRRRFNRNFRFYLQRAIY